MTNLLNDPAWNDSNIPLCFDTNALYGFKETPKFLSRCRNTWPTRKLLIPTTVVAEQVRHWISQRSAPFDATQFESFLENYTVVTFDLEAVLHPWHEVVSILQSSSEPWHYRDVPFRQNRNEACAHVCQWPDHTIHAIARQHKALLVTDDKALANRMTGYQPGTVSRHNIEELLR